MNVCVADATKICKSHWNRFIHICTTIFFMWWKKERRSNENAMTKHRFYWFYCWLLLYRRCNRARILRNSKKICAKKRHQRHVGWNLEKKKISVNAFACRFYVVFLSALWIVQKFSVSFISQRETNIILTSLIMKKSEKKSRRHQIVWGVKNT